MALVKPPFSPPGWVFGVVWACPLRADGIAAYKVCLKPRRSSPTQCSGMPSSLPSTFTWSIIFFRFKLFWAGVAVIIALDLLVAHTTYLFWKVSRGAGLLMLPYLIWNFICDLPRRRRGLLN
jgi:tryptophan-rich sensory protein